MRTSITLPDAVAQAADRLAKRLGVSRSEVIARAVAAYTAQGGAPAVSSSDISAAEITQRLNACLSELTADGDTFDAAWKAARNRALGQDDW